MYVNDDVPKDIMAKRCILQLITQKARSKDLYTFINVGSLAIDGKKYTTDDVGKLVITLHPHKHNH